MAITYKNTWGSIITALKSKIKAEMKCPVFSQWDEVNKSTQFIRLITDGSTQEEIMVHSELSTYEISIQYIFQRRNNAQFQNYVLENISRLEALVHDNPTLTLSDGSKAYNVVIGDLEFDIEDEELQDFFITQYNFNCQHRGNLA